MSFSGLIAIIALAAAGVFAVLNQPLLYESREIALLGGTYAIPLIGILLGGAAAAIVLMLLGEAATAAGWRASNARLTRKLHEREREIVELSGAYETIEEKVEALRQELPRRMDALARVIELTLPAHATDRETLREDRDRAMTQRETTGSRTP